MNKHGPQEKLSGTVLYCLKRSGMQALLHEMIQHVWFLIEKNSTDWSVVSGKILKTWSREETLSV